MDMISRLTPIKAQLLSFPMPARLVLAGLVGTVALAILVIVFRLLFWWGSSGQISARLEPRIGQTLGYLEAEDQVKEALAERNQLLGQLAFQNTGDSGRGGALLQQEIRKLSAQNDLTVIGSEVQEPEELEDLLRLKVNMRVAGAPPNVVRFLQALSHYRPFLFVSTISINPKQRQLITLRSPGREQYDNTLILQLDVYAYQLGERG